MFRLLYFIRMIFAVFVTVFVFLSLAYAMVTCEECRIEMEFESGKYICPKCRKELEGACSSDLLLPEKKPFSFIGSQLKKVGDSIEGVYNKTAGQGPSKKYEEHSLLDVDEKLKEINNKIIMAVEKSGGVKVDREMLRMKDSGQFDEKHRTLMMQCSNLLNQLPSLDGSVDEKTLPDPEFWVYFGIDQIGEVSSIVECSDVFFHKIGGLINQGDGVLMLLKNKKNVISVAVLIMPGLVEENRDKCVMRLSIMNDVFEIDVNGLRQFTKSMLTDWVDDAEKYGFSMKFFQLVEPIPDI